MSYTFDILLVVVSVGIVALAIGARQFAGILMIPSIGILVVAPVLASGVNFDSTWITVFVVPAALLFFLLIFIRVVQAFVNMGYGHEAGGHFAGTYLVRVADFMGRGIWAIIRLPFRLLSRLHRARQNRR